jgi:hypothetical protein
MGDIGGNRALAPAAQLPGDDAGLAAAYRSVLHVQRALLFYDNARDAEQVLPLPPLPAASFSLPPASASPCSD